MANLSPGILGLYTEMRLFRPYLKGIAVSWVSGSTIVPLTYGWDVVGVYTGITTHQRVTLKHQFYAPNTNAYTLGWIIDDYWYQNDPGAPFGTLYIDSALIFKPGTTDMYLSLDSLNFPDWYYLDLPPAPLHWTRGLP